MNVFSRPRGLRRLSLVLIVAAIAVAAAAGGSGGATAAPRADQATSLNRVEWYGKKWFLSGASLPWYNWGCDFGCGKRGGVVANQKALNQQFATAQAEGVRVIRWYAFPWDPWQIERAADGTPTRLNPSIYADFDAAAKLARAHDIHLVFVIFADMAQVPRTWLSDATQRHALAASLRPLIHRYARNDSVLGWEIANEPDVSVARGVPLADAQATIQAIAEQIRTYSHSTASVGPSSIDQLTAWGSTKVHFLSPHSVPAATSGTTCVTCESATSVRSRSATSLPLVIGAVPLGGSDASTLLSTIDSRGYAGAWAWALRPTDAAGAQTPNTTALRSFFHQHAYAGPRDPLLENNNPCMGPNGGALLCPDIQMGSPFNLWVDHRKGKTLLRAGNSINSVGAGPIEFHGRRSGQYTMSATQRIYRKRGGYINVVTGATLYFKPVPGQYRYWKFRNAARFELWRLNAQGRRTKLVKVGPKAIYCLRDLKHTRPGLARSPHSFVYPGCSQDLSAQTVRLGTSVGWSDVYPSTYNEQWIDVTGLKGCFAYVHVADPYNHVFESNESNNVSQTIVRLPYTGSRSGCRGRNGITHLAPVS